MKKDKLYFAKNVLQPNWFFSKQGTHEKVTWCQEQFGPVEQDIDRTYKRWHVNKLDIVFRYEKDYILFVLRWG